MQISFVKINYLGSSTTVVGNDVELGFERSRVTAAQLVPSFFTSLSTMIFGEPTTVVVPLQVVHLKYLNWSMLGWGAVELFF